MPISRRAVAGMAWWVRWVPAIRLTASEAGIVIPDGLLYPTLLDSVRRGRSHVRGPAAAKLLAGTADDSPTPPRSTLLVRYQTTWTGLAVGPGLALAVPSARASPAPTPGHPRRCHRILP